MATGTAHGPYCDECGEPLTVEGDNDPAMGADPQHVFCGVCGQVEHPADLTPDWNGETGNHLSCESRRWTLDHGQLQLDGRPLLTLVRAQWGDDAPLAATLDSLSAHIVALLNAEGAEA